MSQRHLCAQLGAQSLQLRWLGLQEDVEKWPETMAPHFGALTLFPLVVRYVANDASQDERAMPPARQVQERHPELVTARMSLMLHTKHWAMSKPPVMPSDARWFTPHVPTGTAFDLSHRTLAPGCPRPGAHHLRRAMGGDRASRHVGRLGARLAARPWRSEFLAVVQKALGNIPEFDLRAARLMHEELNANATQ